MNDPSMLSTHAYKLLALATCIKNPKTLSCFGLALIWILFSPQQLFAQKSLTVAEMEQALQTKLSDKAKLEIYLNLFDSIFYSDNLKANTYNQLALPLAKVSLDNSLLGKALHQSSAYHYFVGNFDEAIKLALESNLTLDEQKDQSLIAGNFSILGNVYSANGSHSVGMEYLFRSIGMYKETGNKTALAQDLSSLGLAYIDLKYYTKAEEYLKESMELNRSAPSPESEVVTLQCMAYCASEQKQYNKAIALITQSLEQAQRYKLHLLAADIHAQFGRLHAEMGNPSLGIAHARMGINICKREQDDWGLAIAHEHYSYVLLKLNRLDSALYYNELALEGMHQMNLATYLIEAYETRTEIFKKLGRLQESLQAFRKAKQLDEDLSSQADRNYFKFQQEAYQNWELESSLSSSYQEKLEQGKLMRWILLGILALGVLGLFLFLRTYRYRQQVNTQLLESQSKIEDQRQRFEDLNNYKNQLFGMIAHDFRLPLDAIQKVLSGLSNPNATENYQTEALKVLQRQTHSSLNLLEDILFTARFQLEKYEPLRQEFSLNSLIEEQLEAIRLTQKMDNLGLSVEVPEDIELYGDVGMLKIALRNLLSRVIAEEELPAVSSYVKARREEDTTLIEIAELVPKTSVLSKEDQLDRQHKLEMIRNFLESNGGKLSAFIQANGPSKYIVSLPDPSYS
jgi:signal transduction histidine kinase